MSWQSTDFGQYVEVLPLADSREHFVADECWCRPRRADDSDMRPIIVHRSHDGREFAECFCRNVENQSYGHVVAMHPPFVCEWQKTAESNGNQFKGIPIDVCIATEIAELWHEGVETLNSCCGHGRGQASVIVDEANRLKMKELGYSEYYIAPSGLPCVSLRTGTRGGTE